MLSELRDPREARGVEEAESEVTSLRRDLDLAKARSEHLAAVAAERAHELEALQVEIRELTRGDRGKEALIGEQKVMREKVRELRGLLDAALTKNRDAEEAKLHLEHKTERLARVLDMELEHPGKTVGHEGGDTAAGGGDVDSGMLRAHLDDLRYRAREIADEPIKEHHLSAMGRLRAEMSELEVQLRERDERVSGLYERLREQAAMMADKDGGGGFGALALDTVQVAAGSRIRAGVKEGCRYPVRDGPHHRSSDGRG